MALGRSLLKVLIGLFLFCVLCAFPWRTDLLHRDAEEAFEVPDSTRISEPAEVWRALHALSPDTRALYAGSELTLDLAFPWLYGGLLAALLAWAWPRQMLGSPSRRLWTATVVALPLVAVAADLTENWALFEAARMEVYENATQYRDTDLAAATWLDFTAAANRAQAAQAVKFRTIYVALALVVIGAVWRLLQSPAKLPLGSWLRYLWLGRVPIGAIATLLVLALLGGGDQLSPTIPNMLLLEGPVGLGFVTFLATIAAVVASFHLLLVWELAPERFGAGANPSPGSLARITSAPHRWIGAAAISLPLVGRCALRSIAENGLDPLSTIAALSGGLASAWALLYGCSLLQPVVARWAARHHSHRVGRFLLHLGPGYVFGGQLHPGHSLAAAVFALCLAIYLAAGFVLAPGHGAGSHFVPALAYVLGMVIAGSAVLSGLTFFFDRHRVPLLGVLLGIALLSGFVGRLVRRDAVNHRFEGTWIAQVLLPEVEEAAKARLQRLRLGGSGARIATVVTARGGGIQAAAWTASVLTGLDAELGPEFPRSILAISSVSGGSVGSLMALEALSTDGTWSSPEKRAQVVSAASASSLEATAWGLLFPDTVRAVPLASLFIPATIDRAWAMESAWSAAMATCRLKSGDATHWSHWVEASRSGAQPAVIFNATKVEDGRPLRISTVRTAGPHGDRFDYRRIGGLPGYLDLATTTAARLSATFPYVTPLARPNDPLVQSASAADGGYFDNDGVVALLDWLRAFRKSGLESEIDRLVWIHIDPFPQRVPINAEPGTVVGDQPGWITASLGPLQTLFRVRTASQHVRKQVEVDLVQRLMGEARIEVLTLRPDLPWKTDPPLSWNLSRSDRRQVCRNWNESADSTARKRLREIFGASTAPDRVDCERLSLPVGDPRGYCPEL